jgi:predicted transcriptional regulator
MGEDIADKVSFRLRGGLLNKIDRIAATRNTDRTEILNEAITGYIERQENPEILKEQIRQILKDDPTVLDEAIKKLRLEIKPLLP